MEKQVFLLGDKHNGNDIKETNCPCCNSNQLVHGLPEVFDGRFVRDPWECMICGSSGIAESTAQFSQHIVEVDKTKKTLIPKTMYLDLAINKKHPNEYHSFTWLSKNAICINGISYGTDDFEIVQVKVITPN